MTTRKTKAVLLLLITMLCFAQVVTAQPPCDGNMENPACLPPPGVLSSIMQFIQNFGALITSYTQSGNAIVICVFGASCYTFSW